MAAVAPGEQVTDADLARRRVIEVALGRRPGMTVGDLRRVLARLDVEASTETILADLDALGFDLEGHPGDPSALAAPSTVDHDAGPADADERAPVGPSEGAPAGDEPEGVPTARRWGRLVPVLAVLAALLVVAAVVIAVVDLLTDDDASEATADTRVAVSDEEITFDADADVFGDAGPADVALAFEEGGPLPTPGEVGPWDPSLGDWFVNEGAAHVTAPGEEEAVAFFAAPGPDADVSVALPSASPGAGVAVRLLDARDYLAWTLTPDGRGVQLVRVADARQEVLLTPDAEVAPGVVLGVRARGTDLELLVDDEVVETTTDDGPTDRVGVGLVVMGTDQVPDFDDLAVTFV